MRERLDEFVRLARTPLYANAHALVLNQIQSAGFGFIYWFLAGRLYPSAVVGAGSAVISALLLISGVAQLGFGNGMTRFLPRAGLQTRRIIIVAYAAVTAMSVVLALIFVAAGKSLGLQAMLGSGPLVLVWTALAAVLWSIFRLQDAVLVGLRESVWVLVENTIFNIAKIVLLVVGVGLLGNAGVVGSWFLPTPIVIVLCTWLIFGVYTRSSRMRPAPEEAEALTIREVAWSSGGDHVGSLFAEAASRLLPLVIIGILGGSATAYFTTAWLVATTLQLLAGGITDSFTAEAAADCANIARYSRDALRYMAVLIAPAALVLGIGAPLLFAILPAEYGHQGASLLRWLCLASPLVVFNTWYLAYARVIGQIGRVVSLEVIGAALMLGILIVTLRPLGINAVALAWAISQAVITIAGVTGSRHVLFGSDQIDGGAATA